MTTIFAEQIPRTSLKVDRCKSCHITSFYFKYNFLLEEKTNLNASFATVADPSTTVLAVRIVAESKRRFLTAWMSLVHVSSDRNWEETATQFTIGFLPCALLAGFAFPLLFMQFTTFYFDCYFTFDSILCAIGGSGRGGLKH